MLGKNAFGPPQPQGDVPLQRFGPSRSRQISDYQRQQNVVAADSNSWNWWTVVWTSAVFLLCPLCAYFTLGALLCNIFAYVDHTYGDGVRKEAKLRWAMSVSVAAFIAGCITLLIVLVVLFTALGAQDWIPPLPRPV